MKQMGSSAFAATGSWLIVLTEAARLTWAGMALATRIRGPLAATLPKATRFVHVAALTFAVAVGFVATPGEAGTHKSLQEYKALNRAQAMRALGYSESAATSRLCPSMNREAKVLRGDLLQFYSIPAIELARDAQTRAGTRAGAAEAKADMRNPWRYCDGLDEVLSVWRSYTLRPDTEYP